MGPGASGLWLLPPFFALFCRDGSECSAGSDGWLTVHGALRLNDKTLLSASVQPCVTAAVGVHGGSKESFDSRWSGHQREISTPEPLDSQLWYGCLDVRVGAHPSNSAALEEGSAEPRNGDPVGATVGTQHVRSAQRRSAGWRVQ